MQERQAHDSATPPTAEIALPPFRLSGPLSTTSLGCITSAAGSTSSGQLPVILGFFWVSPMMASEKADSGLTAVMPVRTCSSRSPRGVGRFDLIEVTGFWTQSLERNLMNRRRFLRLDFLGQWQANAITDER